MLVLFSLIAIFGAVAFAVPTHSQYRQGGYYGGYGGYPGGGFGGAAYPAGYGSYGYPGMVIIQPKRTRF